MHNVRKTPRTVKNIRENDASYSKAFKSNCSCPNNPKFKNDQSKGHDKTRSNNNSFGKTAEESEKFLRDELKKYGLAPRSRKVPESKHFNSPRHVGRVDINLKSVPEARTIKVNIKEILSRNKFKSKTVPNLPSDRYVDDLKQEIKSMSREIPTLPEKYKRKYLKYLKEELYLNKLASNHDNSQQIESIKNEIETFRSHNSPFIPDNMQYSKTESRPTELKITIHRKKDKLKNHVVRDRAKKTEKKTEAGDASYDRLMKSHLDSEKHKEPKGRKENHYRNNEDVENSSSPVTKKEKFQTTPVKKYTTISTQCEIEMPDLPSDFKMAEKLDAIYDLIPQISSVIEKSEKNLEKAFKNAWKSSKIIQDRGVSPIKDILGLQPAQEDKKEVSSMPETSPNSLRHSNLVLDSEDGSEQPPNTHSSHIGDLLVNIQNIKDNRYLLSGFQNELLQLKKNIEDCKKCQGMNRNGENSNDDRNYCESHSIYIPLLKVGDQGSKSDQIKLFNVLRTEAGLKKELERLVLHISHLERKLSKMKKTYDQDKIKAIEKELELANSYYNNLIVKQQNERVLSEQQKIMRDDTEHECVNVEDCDKCCLHRQIHDLLAKVRENIAKDIEDSKQPLKIQKMPNIDIRKPLQLQNILKLDIPPSSPPQISTRSNFVFEAIVKDDKNDESQREAIKTKITVNKTTSVGVSSHKNKDSKRITKKTAPYVQYGNVTTSESLSEEKNATKIASTRASPKRHPKSTKMSKSPSELGFRQHVGSQCDSTTCLMEPEVPTTKKSAHTQTAVGNDDSFYLFGFKEYLMKEAGSSPVKQVDVMLQASFEGSSDSVMKFKSVDVDTQEDDGLSKTRSCDLQGVTLVAPKRDSQSDEGSEMTFLLNEENFGETQGSPRRRSRILVKTPSLRKMLLPPSVFPQSQQAALEASIQNPYIEPKYRMKRFSVTPQESDMEDLIKPGNDFYKSLTNKEELPERKPVAWFESRSNIPLGTPSGTRQDFNLPKSDLIQNGGYQPNEGERNVTLDAGSQYAKRPIILEKSSMENESEPQSTSNENNFKIISLIENTPIEDKDDFIMRKQSTHNKSEVKAVPDENNSETNAGMNNESIQANDDDQTTGLSAVNQNSAGSSASKKMSIDDKLERKQMADLSNPKYSSALQDEFIEIEENDKTAASCAANPNVERPSIPKKTSDDNESKPEQIADNNYSTNLNPQDGFKEGEGQTGGVSAAYTHSPRNSVTKMAIALDKSEPEEIIEENYSTKMGLLQNGFSKSGKNGQPGAVPANPNFARSSFTKKTIADDQSEPKQVAHENNSKKMSSPQNELTRPEDKDSNSKFPNLTKGSMNDRPVIGDEASKSKNDGQNTEQFVDNQENKTSSIARTSVTNKSESRTGSSDENIDYLQILKKEAEPSSSKFATGQKLYTYIPDEYHFDEHLANVIDQPVTPKKKSVSEEKLYRYVPQETSSSNSNEYVIKEPKTPTGKSNSANLFQYMEDMDKSKNDFELEESQNQPSVNMNDQETVNTDLTAAQAESSEDSKQQGTVVNGIEDFQTDQSFKNADPQEIKLDENQNKAYVHTETMDQIDSDGVVGKALGEKDGDAGFLEYMASIVNLTKEEEQKQNNTVLPIFPPTYKLIVNKKADLRTKLSEKNVLLRYPSNLGRQRSLKLAESSRSRNKNLSDLYDTDEFIVTSLPHASRGATNVTNYILPAPKDQILYNRSCSSKLRSEVPKIAQERLAYSRKCSNIEESQDSSLVSSEGEVVCNCKNISAGEIHSCPRGRVDTRKKPNGISYKDNLSSHLLLERERKHYNHWVTYYATKRYKNESSSSSSQGDSVHDI